MDFVSNFTFKKRRESIFFSSFLGIRLPGTTTPCPPIILSNWPNQRKKGGKLRRVEGEGGRGGREDGGGEGEGGKEGEGDTRTFSKLKSPDSQKIPCASPPLVSFTLWGSSITTPPCAPVIFWKVTANVNQSEKKGKKGGGEKRILKKLGGWKGEDFSQVSSGTLGTDVQPRDWRPLQS